MITIRGATTIDKDTPEIIYQRSRELLIEVINKNKLSQENISAIFFTCTRDIQSAYPAPAARELGLDNVSLMCMQEMYVAGSLEKCIRICLFYDSFIEKSSIKYVYLHNAVHLRPDCAAKEE